MANIFPIKSSFTAGEVAPALYGRPDLQKYSSGVKTLENFRVMPYGGISKRNGTKFVQKVKDVNGALCRLVPFQFSLDDSYMLELGDYYVRFYRDGAPVLDSDDIPYEITSPYSIDELSALSWTQSADVLFIVCPTKRPYELARYGELDWRFSEFDFENGPFATRTSSDIDASLSFSGTTGDITVTSSTDVFHANEVGSIWNVVHAVDAASAKTSGDAAATSVTITVYTLHSAAATFESGDRLVTRDEVFLFAISTSNYASYKNYLVSGQKLTIGGVVYTLTGNIGSTAQTIYYTDSTTGSASSTMNVHAFTVSPNHSFTGSVSGTINTRGYYRTTQTMTFSHTTSTINKAWGINLMVYDTWHLIITGFWYGSIALERYDGDEGRWITVDIYSSPQTTTGTAVRNFDITGEVSEPAEMRVRSISGFTGFVPSGNADADKGYVELSRPSSANRGIFRITEYISSESVNATVLKALYGTSGTTNWQRGAWSDYEGWPRSVGFFEERLVFGGTTLEPQTLWLSRTGDYYDFGSAIQVIDSDAITKSLASRQLNRIEAIVPMNNLLVLTSGSEWKITGGNSGITPSNFMARPQGARGCNTIEPVIANATIIFAQAKGSKVNDLLYNYDTDLYQGTDLSVLAPHIFEDYRVMDWTFQPEPDGMLWMVREDGMLISLTYLKEHDVVAWARHPMKDATVHAIGCLNARLKDTVYLIVHRNGVYTVETLDITKEKIPEKCYYLDGGLMFESTTDDISEVSGLDHLNGMEVSLLVNGDVSLYGKEVVDGAVSLDYPARYVSVGIPYTATVETLDLGFDNGDGSQLTRKAKISRAMIRVRNTRGLLAQTNDSEESIVEVKDRYREGQGSPIELYSGDIDINLISTFNTGRIKITSPEPLPATILAIVPMVAMGGF